MPTPLVILFWIWLAISVGIYISRLFKRGAAKSQADESITNAESGDELPLDSPDRWAKDPAVDDDADPANDSAAEAVETAETAEQDAADAEPATPVPATPAEDVSATTPEPSVAAALAEQNLESPAASSELPVAEVASRLEPLVDESHIEPSVLSAMSPTQRAALGTTAAAATGGLFDPQVRAAVLDQTEYDHQPLSDLLTGIKLPCDLLPAFRAASNDHYAIFTTTSASPAEVAAQVASELERLGFDVAARPPAGARATRDSSAVDLVVTLVEGTEDESSHVEVEFTSL